MKRTRKTSLRNRGSQAGLTLVETMVALLVLLTAATGLMGVAGVAVSTTETQGHLAARTAEYSQDKMEQLMALKFGDSTSNTAPTSGYITTPTGGAGLAVGGSLTTATNNYVDYLDASGNPVASTANWEYMRTWQITAPTTSLKQISVRTQVSAAVGYSGRLPESTVVALKSFPF